MQSKDTEGLICHSSQETPFLHLFWTETVVPVEDAEFRTQKKLSPIQAFPKKTVSPFLQIFNKAEGVHGGKKKSPQLHSLALTKVGNMKSAPAPCSSTTGPGLVKATIVIPEGARCAYGTAPGSLADKGCEGQASTSRGRDTYCKLGQNNEILLEFLCSNQCSALMKPLIRKDLHKQRPTWHINK